MGGPVSGPLVEVSGPVPCRNHEAGPEHGGKVHVYPRTRGDSTTSRPGGRVRPAARSAPGRGAPAVPLRPPAGRRPAAPPARRRVRGLLGEARAGGRSAAAPFAE